VEKKKTTLFAATKRMTGGEISPKRVMEEKQRALITSVSLDQIIFANVASGGKKRRTSGDTGGERGSRVSRSGNKK